MIVNSFKNKIFPIHLKKKDFEDEDEDQFYAPKEITARSEIPNCGIREMFEDKKNTKRYV